jgi:hypothetical protein
LAKILAGEAVADPLITAHKSWYPKSMDIPLSPQQRDAINARPGEPVPLIDAASSERYFLVPAPAFLHLQGLAKESDEHCHRQLKQLIREGIDSPSVDAEKAFARLHGFAARLMDDHT